MNFPKLFACAVLVTTSAVLISCGGSSSQGISPLPVTDVYVAGWEMSNSAGGSAMVWKNGTPVASWFNPSAQFEAIAVSGSDVYVAGTANPARTLRDQVMYWKNGVPVALTDGTQVALAKAIFVQGKDVYVAGGYGGVGPNLAAAYWKNGVPVPLTDGTQLALAFAIQVVGPDVYVAGYENKQIMVSPGSYTLYSAAKYWKNGVVVDLTDGTNPAEALSLFVSGPDVYTAGFACNSTAGDCLQAVYWKNGVPTSLASAGTIATSIAVTDSDVFAAGDLRTGGMLLWKDGAVSSLAGSGYTEQSQVVVSGQDVYVAGVQQLPGGGFHAGYWKNTVAVPLTEDPNTAQSAATSIAVVTH